LELIRHWMDYGFVYDRAKRSVKYLNDILVIAAMGPPGGGRNAISQRIQSRFNVLNMTFPQEKSVQRMFKTIVDQKLQDFEEDVKPLGELITNSTIEIYHIVANHLLPTPAKTHYLFNMRDISKVIQGLMRANKEYYDSRESITKLWIHEIMRVFQDRLVDKEDREFLKRHVNEKLTNHFNTSLDILGCEKKLPLFADVTGDPDTLIYEEVIDHEKLRIFMNEKLEEYNSEPGYVQLNLVLFNDAIGHVLRIARILRLLNGNVLLVGVGGSGRQSLARLAAYLVQSSVFQIKITKYYRHIEFREDLKKLYRQAGVDNKSTTFLMTDSQIVSNNFLEDIGNILSTGEVPNLFTSDEASEIKQALQENIKGDRITDDAIMSLFIERVRTNLHMVLCMSPVGEAFRTRLRMFPALVNCTTIDWFSEWPDDALLEVAMKYMDGFDLGSDSIRKNVSQMFVNIHLSVAENSLRMFSELRRYNCVTPINYLELVNGYRQILTEKKTEMGSAAKKLRNGLSKLDDTRESVQQISVELEVTIIY
jgi:dynein heavy chain